MTREQIEAALYDHREDALTCYDHPPTVDAPSWCCVCGEHGLTVSWRAHVAEVIAALIRDELIHAEQTGFGNGVAWADGTEWQR